ncbi:50S ribosomal protein L15 [Candidatus Pacearchaeota archaeon CG_4_9_14_0_2_um_filter_39_13]|nr:50S ribosomal protein L15 [Candidatus Pacearchaeota archaeon]PJC44342.1 MAG: 50S ribosomal protein L15 [Candidatus Pacearchaeota archaeon CG_4_9_14_0_2_um_filter_39_13]
MNKVKKRQKKTRYRGTHTHGRGFKKKARGKGHRGGVGMAGTGKRADQKKTIILNLKDDYFGTSRRLAGRKIRNVEVVDVGRIMDRIDVLIRKGIAKESKEGYELNLEGKKVLCTGELNVKLNIKAASASKSAEEKIRNAGGDIEFVLGKKEKPSPKSRDSKNKKE